MTHKYTTGQRYFFDINLPVFHPPRAQYAGNFDEHFIQGTVADFERRFALRIYEDISNASPHWKMLKNERNRFPSHIQLSPSSGISAIPFGALVGLAADHYKSASDLYYTSIQEINANMWVIQHAREVKTLIVEPKQLTPESDAVRNYFRLLLANYDHFNSDQSALRRFRKEMIEALSLAKMAFETVDLRMAQELYHESLTHCAFACHFLTDCFSAGHMRTPRRAAVKACTKIYGGDMFDLAMFLPNVPLFMRKDELIGALYSMVSHDIDSKNGLFVESKHPETQERVRYQAKGDGFIKENRDGLLVANKAVSCALLAIYQMRFFGRCDYNPQIGHFDVPDSPEQYIPTMLPENPSGAIFPTSENSVDGFLWQNTTEERAKTGEIGVIHLARKIRSMSPILTE